MKNLQGNETPTSGNQVVSDQPVKVLLVDDRPDKLTALQSILAGPALELVLAHDFAVILLDVSMPIMDGFETASLIRQRKNSEHTPIIFITAYSDSEMPASRGYSLGAVDYIFSPVNPDILRAKVSVFIDLFKKSQMIQYQSEWLRKQAERRASSLEIRLEDLLNRLNVGVFSATSEGVLINANPAFFRLFGINPAIDPATFNLARLYPQEADRAQLIARLESEGQVQDYHVRQRHLDGTLIWVSLSKVLVTDAKGVQHIDGLVEDITHRKMAEVTDRKSVV